MDSSCASPRISLIIVRNAPTGGAIPLDAAAINKLGSIPKFVRASAAYLGPLYGDVVMEDGAIHITINPGADLFEVHETLANDLAIAAHQIHENSQLQPPRPLTQAVTNPRCIDLLRAASQANETSGLTAAIRIDRSQLEIPCVPPAAFTEPERPEVTVRHLRSKVSGLLVPSEHANIVALANEMKLELPLSDYPIGIDDLYERVIKAQTLFVGAAHVVGKNTYRANPGGDLQTQMSL